MKRLLLAIFMVSFMAQFAISQPWMEYIQEPNKNEELTLNDFRDAFNRWINENQIVEGKKKINDKWVKVPGYKLFKRWEYFWDLRVNRSTSAFPKTNAAVQYAKYKAENTQKSSNGNWAAFGPSATAGGYAGLGRVNCIEFHPTDVNTFWIGTPSGGMWETTDGGGTWNPLTDGNDVIGVSDIALANDFTTSNTMFIATGDRDGGSSWTLGGGVKGDNNSIGILKSTDGGQSWATTGLTFGVSDRELIGRILIDPIDGQIMLAATTNGIYRSTNGGAAWSLVQSGAYFIDMEFKPGNSDIVYASTSDYTAAEIYRSTNNGASWSQVESFASSRRAELAVTPHDATYVYAIVANSDRGLKGIYKSIDSGASFSLEFDGNSTNGALLGYYSDGSESNTGQGSYDLCIAVNPTDKNDVFIGGINSWRSTDGGSAWVNNNMWTSYSGYNFSGSPVVHADKHFLKFRESDGALFEGNDGGIYRTTNSGTTWTDLSNDLYITQIYRLGVAQSVNNMTIIGNQDNGSKMFDGSSWDDVTGGDGMECAIDPTDENVQYATYTNGTLYRTTDGWYNRTTISDNITSGNNGWWVSPYAIHPADNQTLIVGYDTIWKSTDRGDSWAQLGSLVSPDKFRSLAVSESNSSVMLIADPDDIWYTSNGGTSWTDITGTLPTYNYSITYVAIHATDPNTLWVTMGGYDGNRVYESINGGTSWTNISSGLPNLPVMTIVQNKQETLLNELYVGTDRGVYMKRGSADWIPFMTNLPNVVVTELEIYYDANPLNSKLRAATFGRGLWESDLYTAGAMAPVADFEAVNTTVYVGQSVQFNDLSTNSPDSWDWTFTGGTPSTSDIQNPVVSYAAVGTYNVSLTAENGTGSDTETKVSYITVEEMPDFPSVTNFQANVENQNDVALIWNKPIIVVPPLSGIDDGFESYTDFALDFAPWTQVDNDGGATYSITDHTFTNQGYTGSFIIFNPSGVDPANPTGWDPRTGSKAAVCFNAVTASAPNDDWLISPQLSINGAYTLSFWAKSITDQYGLERMKVGISTGGNAVGDFTIVSNGSYEEVPTAYTQYTYDLSSYDGQDIYFAINCMSNDAFALFIDDVLVTDAKGNVVLGNSFENEGAQAASGRQIGEWNRDETTVYKSLTRPKSSKVSFSGYNLHRTGESSAVYTINSITDTTYTDLDLSSGDYDYYVIANYVDPAGSSEESNHASVSIVSLPVAAFSGTPTSGDMPLTVLFTDASSDATSWSWDFGDGGNSTDQNPSYQYVAPGTYTVSLTATNSYGSDTETKTNYITVNALQAVAQFEGNPTESNYDTLTVFFTNLSDNADDFSWDFGDENTSIEISPSHQYMAPGVYTVSLVASNNFNSDTETKDGYIVVHGVGIELVNEANIHIYPNPGKGIFNLNPVESFTGKVNVKILDQKANMLDQKEMDLSQPQQIDLTGQSAGIYYLLFENNGKQFIKRVVVE